MMVVAFHFMQHVVTKLLKGLTAIRISWDYLLRTANRYIDLGICALMTVIALVNRVNFTVKFS